MMSICGLNKQAFRKLVWIVVAGTFASLVVIIRNREEMRKDELTLITKNSQRERPVWVERDLLSFKHDFNIQSSHLYATNNPVERSYLASIISGGDIEAEESYSARRTRLRDTCDRHRKTRKVDSVKVPWVVEYKVAKKGQKESLRPDPQKKGLLLFRPLCAPYQRSGAGFGGR